MNISKKNLERAAASVRGARSLGTKTPESAGAPDLLAAAERKLAALEPTAPDQVAEARYWAYLGAVKELRAALGVASPPSRAAEPVGAVSADEKPAIPARAKTCPITGFRYTERSSSTNLGGAYGASDNFQFRTWIDRVWDENGTPTTEAALEAARKEKEAARAARLEADRCAELEAAGLLSDPRLEDFEQRRTERGVEILVFGQWMPASAIVGER